jgi:hypothetical protein
MGTIIVTLPGIPLDSLIAISVRKSERIYIIISN